MHDEGKFYGKKELQHKKVYAFWKEIDFTNSSTVGFNNGKIIRPEEVQLVIEMYADDLVILHDVCFSRRELSSLRCSL